MRRIAVVFAVMGVLGAVAPAAAPAATGAGNSCAGINLPLLRLC